MLTRRTWLPAFLASIALAVPLVAACGGSSEDPPGAAPSDDTVCAAVGKFINSCTGENPQMTACNNAVVAQLNADCSTYAGALSAAYKTALTTCTPGASECQENDPFDTSCFQTALQSLSTTQTKLASDYCAACATVFDQSISYCETNFWGIVPDAGVVSSPGAPYLQLSDSFISRIDGTCVPATGSFASCSAFSQCGNSISDTAFPPSPSACTVTSTPPQAGGDAG
jgi:hypothetical protein